jgi:hypothetical protein
MVWLGTDTVRVLEGEKLVMTGAVVSLPSVTETDGRSADVAGSVVGLGHQAVGAIGVAGGIPGEGERAGVVGGDLGAVDVKLGAGYADVVGIFDIDRNDPDTLPAVGEAMLMVGA